MADTKSATMTTLQESSLQPLDLILFRGIDAVSDMVGGIVGGENQRSYSHAALVVTRDVLDLPFLEPGRIYVFESIIKSKRGLLSKLSWKAFKSARGLGSQILSSQSSLGSGRFKSSTGSDRFMSDRTESTQSVGSEADSLASDEVRFSVQLRDLELVISGYQQSEGEVAWSAFRGKRPSVGEMRRTLLALYEENPHPHYSKHLMKEFGMIYPALRTAKDSLSRANKMTSNIAKKLRVAPGTRRTEKEKSSQYLFTSDLSEDAYHRLGIDILSQDQDDLDAPSARPEDFLAHKSLFVEPVPLVSEDGKLAGLRAERSNFMRHLALQERLQEHAEKRTRGRLSVADDGRLDIQFADIDAEEDEEAQECVLLEEKMRVHRARAPVVMQEKPPPLSIAILVSGTRGDVQPFMLIGKRLQKDGHRVRLATHVGFRDFVESNGLEFYPLGGDPKELVSYMIKTHGKMIPRNPNQLSELPKQHKILKEIIESTLPACTAKDPDRPDAKPFTADAIISNPVTYGHIHVAEALGVPLHMIFTMPWSPTRAFPHAMANMDFRKKGRLENYLSYGVVDSIMWTGTADVISDFRKNTLGLPPVQPTKGPGLLNSNLVPFTYLWSPSLVETPKDWGDHIDVADFIFFNQATEYDPPEDLVAFLDKGDPPIYIGFGSLVVQNPEKVTETIFEALHAAGKRGIVSKGWGGLGTSTTPENVYLIGNCPHDWLFPRCSAVCHHGGAGTTATGLRAGRPTIIVPFFADQPFWAAMVEQAGAGPSPIPIRELTTKRLTKAFQSIESPEISKRASEIGESLRSRDGADLAAKAFYRNLPTSARGIMTHLGFTPEERQKILSGKAVLKKYPVKNSATFSIAVSGRVGQNLANLYNELLDGWFYRNHPDVLEFGALGDRDAEPSDFEAAGYTDDEWKEVAALLNSHRGSRSCGTFNLSLEEMDRFQEIRERFPGNHPSHEAISDVNKALREMLLKRHRLYREKGLNGIPPYARKVPGDDVEPGELLREVIVQDTLLQNEFPLVYKALLEYPKPIELERDHRFYWVKMKIDGHPTFVLTHHASIPGAGLALHSERHFYIGRGLDVHQLQGMHVPLDINSSLVIVSDKVYATNLEQVRYTRTRAKTGSNIGQNVLSVMEAFTRL